MNLLRRHATTIAVAAASFIVGRLSARGKSRAADK